MFCREQVARFGAHHDEIASLGARILAIGNGTPAMAQGFVRQFPLPFPVFTDPSRQVYALAGMKRSFGLGLGALKAGMQAMKAGHRQGRTQGDPWQQGGALIVVPPGEIVYEHVDQFAGDHVEPAVVVEALKAVVGGVS